jgi:glutamate dehydrogenase
MTDLNTALDGLDNKVPGDLQLSLYESVQELLHDRLVWFLRHVDVSRGLGALVTHYAQGIEALARALERVLPTEARTARDARVAGLTDAGVPADLARRVADLASLGAAPDIVLVADRTAKPIAEVAATYFAAGAYFGLDRIRAPAREIQVSDYFDRLALDRALDSIADAERRITIEMVADGGAGQAAVEAWVAPRREEVGRIRAAVDEIARSSLTISKLSVAASLVGDLVKQ